jgi:hypothetical protein
MRLAVIAGLVFGGRMWTGRRDSRPRRDRLPMLREMRSERLMISKSLSEDLRVTAIGGGTQ